MRRGQRSQKNPKNAIEKGKYLFVVHKRQWDPRTVPKLRLFHRLLEYQVNIHDRGGEFSQKHEDHGAHVPRSHEPRRDHVEGREDVVDEEHPVIGGEDGSHAGLPRLDDVSHDGVVDHVARAVGRDGVRDVSIPWRRIGQFAAGAIRLGEKSGGQSGKDDGRMAEGGHAGRDEEGVGIGGGGPSEGYEEVAVGDSEDGEEEGAEDGEADVDFACDVQFGSGAVGTDPGEEDGGVGDLFFVGCHVGGCCLVVFFAHGWLNELVK
mmetsp:Transcript_8417/g.16776  ORF Transcript_8417/g.16776 Transcript_8417/m.16776 type:complete len:263 (+) Transcript_8417:418-1206(+)